MNNLSLIIEREYFERVKRKSFIITTLLVPIVMIAIMLAPTLILLFSDTQSKKISVVDNTGVLAGELKGNDEISFITASAPVDSLRNDESVEAILVINSDAVDNPKKAATLLTRESIGMMTDSYITEQLKKAIEDIRLTKYSIVGIREIMDQVNADVAISTVRIDGDKETETSSSLSYILSLALDMLLYMIILLYGQQVMTSIIEEKNNRVLEIVVSSVKPFQLMLGKITGVGLVAITQIVIWAILIGTAVAIAVPFLTPENLGSAAEPEMMGAIAQFTNPAFLFEIFITAVLYVIGGFLFYASMFAAVGSAVSNVQDASQLSTIVTLPTIIGIMGSMAIINDPGSGLAFWLSIIPFTSPMAMMARIPYGVPVWEIILSIALLYASFMFMIWLCGKIYRVGIFMYGKKPSFSEIIRWARYK